MPVSPTALLSRHLTIVQDFEAVELPSLRAALAQVKDPRRARGVRYPFTELMLVFIAAVLCGAKSLTMIAEWAADAQAKRLLVGLRSAPSVSTLHRVAAGIDPVSLDAALSVWISARAARTTQKHGLQAVAVDGKEVRGAKHGGGHKVFLMAGLDHATGTVLAQEAVGEKTNEIPHLPALLQCLGPLRGRVVTADALHTLAQQAEAISAAGGHYLFTIKTNAKALHRQASQIGWSGKTIRYRARQKAHGRTSSWEASTTPAPAGLDFPHAAQVMRLHRGRAEHRDRDDTGEIVYAITSLPPHQANTAELAGLLRGHWGIENRLHWVRDTAYDEDASQVRTGNAAHVMASIRNLAISLHRLAGHTNIAATLRAYSRSPELAIELTGL